MASALARWVYSLSTTFPSLGLFCTWLPYTPIHVRKAMLTACRIQVPPLPGSRVYDRLSADLDTTIIRPGVIYNQLVIIPDQRSGHYIMALVSPYLSSYFLAGLLSLLLREFPYADTTFVPEYVRSIVSKEINAALDPPENEPLDYSAFLSQENNIRSLAYNVPRVDVQMEVYRRFLVIKESMRGLVLYPRCGQKSIGNEAQRFISNELRRNGILDEVVETTADLERIYYRYGLTYPGPVEVRSAWKTTDLKPRVYYAQGPTTYYASRYIQSIFNIMVDAFPCVNRWTRYSTRSIPALSADEILFIYDYSSFTSSLHELRRFTEALATFLRGTVVVTLDTRDGFIERDLGDILLEYNQSCNVDPEMDIGTRAYGSIASALIAYHNTGMLGVPGNITSSTLLHGIHLMCLLDTIYSCKCVGDDAIGVYRASEVSLDEICQSLRNLGVIERSKMEQWTFEEDPDMSAWHYVKRPITRLDSKVLLGDMVIWPSLQNILGFTDDYHKLPDMGFVDRRLRFVKQYCRLLSSIQYTRISDEDAEILYAFASYAYNVFRLPRRGQLAPATLDEVHHPVPYLQVWSFEVADWKQHLMDRLPFSSTTFVLPLVRFYEEDIPWTLYSEFESKSSSKLALLVKLGVLENLGMCTESRRYNPEDELDRMILRMYLESEISPVYRYRVIENPPTWAY